ncbi:unnamed protein product [Schistosoma margrebowiei]|uniref:beta-N-acetylhexosaminidase n=1 Tax=Schistosoma margrebowiei TaxID=48269 RepID=A0AA85AF42_9TREM|nr:unnamed protein product [Schistosoma margrebowiei]
MSMVKMNVLHWHIVDDQSFPYVSETFPKLSSKGAFHPYLLIYTPNDVKYLLNYARLRGIRIMPEFDTPGHANSWGKGYPEILTKCYIKGEPDGTLGPINPINNISYNFVSQLYKELFSVFPDNWFHLGGDEVEYNCWRSNPSIIEFMKKMKFHDDYHRLEGYYINNLIQIINDVKPPERNITPIVWQEIFENGFRVVRMMRNWLLEVKQLCGVNMWMTRICLVDHVNNTTSRNTSADQGSDSRTIKSATKSTGNKTIGITGQKSGSTRGTSAKIDFNQAHWKMRIICKKIFSMIYS